MTAKIEYVNLVCLELGGGGWCGSQSTGGNKGAQKESPERQEVSYGVQKQTPGRPKGQRREFNVDS